MLFRKLIFIYIDILLTYGAIYCMICLDVIYGKKNWGGATRSEKTLAQLRHRSCRVATASINLKLLFLKSKEKPPKSEDFEGFLVEISGIEPLTS